MRSQHLPQRGDLFAASLHRQSTPTPKPQALIGGLQRGGVWLPQPCMCCNGCGPIIGCQSY